MQTFLPHNGFDASCEVLDGPRLGKQRVETLQILRALEIPGYGWANHPAVAMWRGRTPALVCYGLAAVAAWRRRGHADTTAGPIAEFAPDTAGLDQQELAGRGLLPGWLGDDRLHRSHRSALVRKDSQTYRPLFGDVPDDLPYFWPDPDEPDTAPAPAPAAPTTRLWVIRPPGETMLGAFLADGVAGLGTESGLDVDLTGLTAADLRAQLAETNPGKRAGRDLRLLGTFLDEVRDGDLVGVPVEDGSALLAGPVTGDYRWARPGSGGPVHRRPVRWDRRLPRSAVHHPHLLQDPRPLFQVGLDTD